MSKATEETGLGVGRFWELFGGGDPGLPCSWALDVLGLRHKHSPGPLASGLLTMNVASPRKWWVMGIRQGKLTRGKRKNMEGKTSGPRRALSASQQLGSHFGSADNT